MASDKIRLRSGTSVDSDVLLADGDLEYVYHPQPLVRSVKRQIGEKFKTFTDLSKKAAKANGELSDADEEKIVRVMCDVIGLMIKPDDAANPDASDFLFDGWTGDKVTDSQIIGLFSTLTGVDFETVDAQETASPS